LPKFKDQRKEKMKRTLIKTIGASVFTLLVSVTFAQISVWAQDANDSSEIQLEAESRAISANARKIEGVWDARVTLRNCQTGTPIAMFRAMDMFHRGGTVTDTNAAPPSTRGPGFGTWEYLGHRRYNAVLRFFLYNPDGSFAGVRRIAQDIELNRGSDEWNNTVGITVFDPGGNVIATACATATATRFP
jgi:hypothetical protein